MASSSSNGSVVYSVKEVRAMLPHLGVCSVYKALREGSIPSIRVGRRLLIPKDRFHQAFDHALVQAPAVEKPEEKVVEHEALDEIPATPKRTRFSAQEPSNELMFALLIKMQHDIEMIKNYLAPPPVEKRSCLYCGKEFSVGPGYMRSDAKSCSPSCSVMGSRKRSKNKN